MAKWQQYSLICVSLLAQSACSGNKQNSSVVPAPLMPAPIITSAPVPAPVVTGKGHRGRLPGEDPIELPSDTPTTSMPDHTGPDAPPVQGGGPIPVNLPNSMGASNPVIGAQPPVADVPADWFPKKVDRQKSKVLLESEASFREIAKKWTINLKLKLNDRDEAREAARNFVIETLYQGMLTVQAVNPELAYALMGFAESAKLTIEGPKKTNDGDGQFKSHKWPWVARLFTFFLKKDGSAIYLDQLAIDGLLEGSLGWERLSQEPIARYRHLAQKVGSDSSGQAASDLNNVIIPYEVAAARNVIFHQFLHLAHVKGQMHHREINCADGHYVRDIDYACSALAWPAYPVRSTEPADCVDRNFSHPYNTLTQDACRGCAGGMIVEGRVVAWPEKADPAGLASCDRIDESPNGPYWMDPNVYGQARARLNLED